MLDSMESARDVEFAFEPQVEGGYHAYAPELPGLHTQGDSLEDATANAEEALALYVEGLREEGRSLQTGIVGAGCRCQLDRAAAGRLRRTTRTPTERPSARATSLRRSSRPTRTLRLPSRPSEAASTTSPS
jgi:predicted RNase H-like HicB family nuclease